MVDGSSGLSASYKLGNGWDILHWCANLTIILMGFTFIPARINAQPDGHIFVAWAVIQVAVLIILGLASQIRIMRPFAMANWASPLRMCATFLIGVAWYFAAHAAVAALGGLWLIEIAPSAVLLSVASVMGFCMQLIIVGLRRRTIFGSMQCPVPLSRLLWCSFPSNGFPLPVQPSAALSPLYGTLRVVVSRNL